MAAKKAKPPADTKPAGTIRVKGAGGAEFDVPAEDPNIVKQLERGQIEKV